MKNSDIHISVVLGSYNRKRFLRAAIESIRKNGISVPYEIIVVDGGSTDGSMKWLSQQGDIITILQHNRGTARGRPLKNRSWGYFMNLGFKCAQGKFILMMSDDCLLIPGAVTHGMSHYDYLRGQGRNVGALAFYWRNWPEQCDYWVGLTLGEKMFVNHGLFLRHAVEEVGWLEEDRYRFYHADGDLCLKLWQRGYEVVDCPDSFVEHFSHANMRARRTNELDHGPDRSAYYERWSEVFPEPRKNNPQRWIYKTYRDPYKTVRRFPKFPVFMLTGVLAYQQIKNSVCNVK